MPQQYGRRSVYGRLATTASVTIIVASLWVISSCVGNRSSASSIRNTNSPASGHWVYSAELRAIMAELDRKARTAWPQEMSGGEYSGEGMTSEERAGLLERMSPLATELAAAARRIPDVIRDTKITPSDRSAIAALAATLGEQADDLKTRIRENSLDEARRVLRDINTTCMSCHDRFRDLCGPMDDTRPRRS